MKNKCKNAKNEGNCLCVNNKCFENKTLYEEMWKVDIEVAILNTSVLDIPELVTTLSTLTGLNENEISISVKLNDDGNIIGLICYVESEQAAEKIQEIVMKCKQNNTLS